MDTYGLVSAAISCAVVVTLALGHAAVEYVRYRKEKNVGDKGPSEPLSGIPCEREGEIPDRQA